MLLLSEIIGVNNNIKTKYDDDDFKRYHEPKINNNVNTLLYDWQHTILLHNIDIGIKVI